MHTLQQLRTGTLQGAVSLKISDGLTNFPPEIFDLADTLEYLDLSANELTELPNDFIKLKKLKVFFCSDNLFKIFPAILGKCSQLNIIGFKANFIETIPTASINTNIRWLILTNNKINALPNDIGSCHRLEKLMLAGNQLTSLPDSLQLCTQLALLRISANRISILPKWLFKMPKLSWLAFSGNPCSVQPVERCIPIISPDSLSITERLGEGASGTIFKASKLDDKEKVAIKIFKGSITSDGYPEDEMNSYIAAGDHKGLVKLIGKIDLEDDLKKGIVMELIPSNFFNLGLPPNLKTCTRDVFKADLKFADQVILQIARSIASVVAHLHQKGIIHGDLYAHNILVDESGNAVLSDFGAASFYDLAKQYEASNYERIEILAFGYFLEDLLSLRKQAMDDGFSSRLINLIALCLTNVVTERPSFAFLENELKLIDL